MINPFIFFPILYQDEKIILMKDLPCGEVTVTPNVYYISNYGRIFSLARGNLYQIAISYTQDGYQIVSLNGSVPGSRRTYRINRLVLLYFNYIPNSWNYDSDHIDGDKNNNYIGNLRWVTHKENMESAIKNGIVKRMFDENDIIDIKRRLVNGESNISIANLYNTTADNIGAIKRGISYKDIVTDYDEILEKNRPRKIHIRYNNISDDMVISIYNEALTNTNDQDIANKYNVTKNTVLSIRLLQYPFNTILGPNKKPIIREANKRLFDDETAIKIYNEMKNGATSKYIKDKYNCAGSVVFDIRLVRNNYSNLNTEYGLEPLSDSRRISKEIAIEAYKMLEAGTSNKDVQSSLNLSEDTVSNIKFCRKAFSYLSTEFNLKPLL